METLENKTSGLLQRARSYLADNTPAFHVWTKRVGFKRAFILKPAENCEYYCIEDSFGFKVKEIAKFFETKEFWYDTISKAFEWQCFSKDFNELEKFKKFFTPWFYYSINKIFFLPFFEKEVPYIFVTVELDDDDDVTLPEAHEAAMRLGNMIEFNDNEKKIVAAFEKNIESGLEISNSRLYILSLKTCIEHELKDIEYPSEIVKQNMIQYLTNCSQTEISHLFRKPNCSHAGTNGEIKVALFAKEDPEEQLLAHHISRTLTNMFDVDSTKEILLLGAGEVQNTKGTIAFLTQG